MMNQQVTPKLIENLWNQRKTKDIETFDEWAEGWDWDKIVVEGGLTVKELTVTLKKWENTRVSKFISEAVEKVHLAVVNELVGHSLMN